MKHPSSQSQNKIKFVNLFQDIAVDVNLYLFQLKYDQVRQVGIIAFQHPWTHPFRKKYQLVIPKH